MAFNFSVFRVRALSAIVFAIIMMSGLLWNDWSFFTLFVMIGVGCLYEFQKLLRLISPAYNNVSLIHKWGLLLLGAAIMTALSSNTLILQNIPLRLIGIRTVPVILVILLLADVFTKKGSLQNWAISFMGLIYIPLGLSLFFQFKGLYIIREFPNWGFMIPLIIIATVWINDTMAYIAGSIIGRTPLSKISPNKTWEGTIAGVILAVIIVTQLTGLLNNYYFPGVENTRQVFILSLTAAIAGNYGDLMESKLKRMAGVKDSGNMMPGHGGFLDRFDSILFAGPFVWLIVQILY
jgi:phosphatidate cytidylyltransferase